MKIITKKILLATVILSAGLLLGGNKQTAYAAGAPEAISQSQVGQMAAIVAQLQEKVEELTAKVRLQNAAKAAAPVAAANLTPEKLAYIASEVNRIAGEVEQVKAAVAQIIEIRRLEREIRELQLVQIAQIKQQIEELQLKIAAKSGKAPVVAVPAIPEAPVASAIPAVPAAEPVLTPEIISGESKTDRAEIENQIAKIKQQISDLTAQAEAQKQAEAGPETADGDKAAGGSSKCEAGQSCAADTKASAEQKSAASENKPAEQKSFWQSIGDFIKKLFTF